MSMKRSSAQIADEILRRAQTLRRRDAKRKTRIYAALTVFACLVVVICFSIAVPLLIGDEAPQTIMVYQAATLFTNGTAGGYVFIGVAAFMLGVVAALFCTRMSEKK